MMSGTFIKDDEERAALRETQVLAEKRAVLLGILFKNRKKKS
jgi:hypothetical protein